MALVGKILRRVLAYSLSDHLICLRNYIFTLNISIKVQVLRNLNIGLNICYIEAESNTLHYCKHDELTKHRLNSSITEFL